MVGKDSFMNGGSRASALGPMPSLGDLQGMLATLTAADQNMRRLLSNVGAQPQAHADSAPRPQARITDDERRRHGGLDGKVLDLNQNLNEVMQTTWWRSTAMSRDLACG
ncbi:MAG: hypothetical protein FJ279_00230 [Planctomycetes bacterium]|nr:hypothetical protein [Planctomycetota bacterium]